MTQINDFSGLNNIRRLQSNPLYEEDSTIVEDESSFFDEQDDIRNSNSVNHHQPNQTQSYDELPLLVEPTRDDIIPNNRFEPEQTGYNRNQTTNQIVLYCPPE